MSANLPELYVEGKDDISVINALLFRHGVDTDQGKQHLLIKDQGSVDTLLRNIPDAIKVATDRPVGFVVDIDIAISNRWSAVRGRLKDVGISPPAVCPATGFLDRLSDYPYPFGVWLMPDCATDNLKLEHLCQSLIAKDDPLWPHAQASVTEAAKLVDEANGEIAEEDKRWTRFHEVDRIKSEIHAWLAWQKDPGAALGSAINKHILGCDSRQALAFLRWLKVLYQFPQLTTV